MNQEPVIATKARKKVQLGASERIQTNRAKYKVDIKSCQRRSCENPRQPRSHIFSAHHHYQCVVISGHCRRRGVAPPRSSSPINAPVLLPSQEVSRWSGAEKGRGFYFGRHIFHRSDVEIMISESHGWICFRYAFYLCVFSSESLL